MILSCFRTMLSLFVVAITLLAVEGKILRVGKHFTGNFVIVDSNSRVTSNCVSNITKNCHLKKCVSECIAEKQCMTFNYHKKDNVCELLNISKFDAIGILQREMYWVHYETDDDASKVNRLLFNIYIVHSVKWVSRIVRVRRPASSLPPLTSHLQSPNNRFPPSASCLVPSASHRLAPVIHLFLSFLFYVE